PAVIPQPLPLPLHQPLCHLSHHPSPPPAHQGRAFPARLCLPCACLVFPSASGVRSVRTERTGLAPSTSTSILQSSTPADSHTSDRVKCRRGKRYGKRWRNFAVAKVYSRGLGALITLGMVTVGGLEGW